MAFEAKHDFADPPRRQRERIAAGEDHLPDFRMGRDIGEGGVERARRKMRRTMRPDDRAAKAETAIDGTCVKQLQQRAIRIAMNDALDRD